MKQISLLLLANIILAVLAVGTYSLSNNTAVGNYTPTAYDLEVVREFETLEESFVKLSTGSSKLKSVKYVTDVLSMMGDCSVVNWIGYKIGNGLELYEGENPDVVDVTFRCTDPVSNLAVLDSHKFYYSHVRASTIDGVLSVRLHLREVLP